MKDENTAFVILRNEPPRRMTKDLLTAKAENNYLKILEEKNLILHKIDPSSGTRDDKSYL